MSATVRMVAQLGGHVNRKRNDEPGPQTVWLGLQRLHNIALCWQLFGAEERIAPFQGFCIIRYPNTKGFTLG